MCGSVALLQNDPDLESSINAALKLLASRGPDGSGISIRATGALGHCRLALRDADGGAQPINLSDGRTLAYVGELYNDHSLRQLLQLSGWKPASTSDTEILTQGIERWGEQVWSRLDAMFAIMLLSEDGKQLQLVRDRFGVKPIFFSRSQNGVAAASQPSALCHFGFGKIASRQAIIHFLRTSQVCFHQQTVFEEIKLVSPGTITTLTVESANQVRWLPKQEFNCLPQETGAQPSKLTHLLSEAVYRQSRADFPVGVFLSGGIDSSLIATLFANMQKEPVQSFAVGLLGDTEDLEYARIVSNHIRSEHTEVIVSPDAFFKGMRELTIQRALPVSLPNEVLIYRLSMTAKHKVKAVLSGEGADELFGGYQLLEAKLKPFRERDQDLPQAYRDASAWFSKDDLAQSLLDSSDLCIAEQIDIDNLRALTTNATKHSSVRSLLLEDHFPHLLLRLDGATMAGSIEGRVPFTDTDVVEFAMSLSEADLAPILGLEKPILRKAAVGLLPESILRRPKKAFHASLSILFASFEGQQALSSATQQPLITKLFSQEKLEQILTEDRESQVFHRTWLICSLGMWSELCRVSEIS